MLWPLVGGAVLANLPLFGLPAVSATTELWYLRAYYIFSIVVYFRWAFLVIDSICSYLGISCLTIPYEKQQENKLANGIAHSNGSAKVSNGNATSGGKKVA